MFSTNSVVVISPFQRVGKNKRLRFVHVHIDILKFSMSVKTKPSRFV